MQKFDLSGHTDPSPHYILNTKNIKFKKGDKWHRARATSTKVMAAKTSKFKLILQVVQEGRYGQPVVSVGLKGLRVLKTTQSAFVNFVDDEYR
jgi:urate oxidase